MEPEHLRFDQRRKMYTKGDCWQGKNSNCVPDGRFGCFACNMWSYVVVVVVFFTLTDRASTIPNNTRGCQSGTWSAGQKNIRGTSTKLQ